MRFVIFRESQETFHVYALGVSVVVHWVCYKTILNHIEGGGQIYDKIGMVELSVDTLYILMFTQVCACFWDNMWWTMTLIPLIIVYKYGGSVLGFVLGGGKKDDDGGDIALSKTQQKKQKRMEKFGGGR